MTAPEKGAKDFIMREQFSTPSHTYKTYVNATKIIDALEDGDYSWHVAVTRNGRFYPVISMREPTVRLHNGGEANFHYFIENKCCVWVG